MWLKCSDVLRRLYFSVCAGCAHRAAQMPMSALGQSRLMQCSNACPLYPQKRPRKRTSPRVHVRLTPESGHSSAPKPQHERFLNRLVPVRCGGATGGRPSTKSDPSQRKIRIFFKLAARSNGYFAPAFLHAGGRCPVACVFPSFLAL